MDVKIRVANEMDAKELLEIYGYYVKNTAISFEYEAPSLEEFTERIRNTLKAYPYLVFDPPRTSMVPSGKPATVNSTSGPEELPLG